METQNFERKSQNYQIKVKIWEKKLKNEIKIQNNEGKSKLWNKKWNLLDKNERCTEEYSRL